ncbi:putative gustatory receptor 2a [Sitophilus oryzae]|uniref:Gustatory receptor 2a n=1 Tax=Sitophilus oryzae TaxID=7048 RepID=A0A6J2XXT5_SITOR|nr:putative gustatory receptor 2a [Sitophilus oryzae]
MCSLPLKSFIRKQISIFSRHLLHEEFSFTACGFFSINAALLQTIVGSVGVYLVMFIQFNSAGFQYSFSRRNASQ